MNATPDFDQARQQAQHWSSRLGALAAGLPASQPFLAPVQPAGQATPSSLSTMLTHLLQRSRAQQHARDKMKANEFLVGA